MTAEAQISGGDPAEHVSGIFVLGSDDLYLSAWRLGRRVRIVE
ncbi:hypothetical protein [Rhodococcus sp. T7]|nr:hypothetical protein [Rhodococcus sp. T7]